MLSRRILRTKVVKAVYAHTQCEGITPAASEKNLVASINKAYDLYFHLLALVPEIAEYAAERIRIGENKKLPTYDDLHPNRKFVDNKVIARLVEDEGLQAEISARKLSWKDNRDLIVALYNALVRQPFYMKYMASDECSFREDAQLVSDIYMTMLEEFEPLESALEAQSILWNDDLGFILTMVSRTILSMRESHEEIKLMEQFKSEDDLDYAKTLLRYTIAGYERISLLLDNSLQNWDIERVALMDQIILITAIAEAESFSSIPVRVTMNEYIDIAKCYSTLSSGGFINGILDRIIARLTEEGKIVKSGKGLL
ncbi:MAG: transcription antitermination factor NusB [Alistipes sp.]|nr:transcription antitermination factor NusB [Alistipes sp.]MBR0338634.1 transcription antitermination factor NusB [Alistipes sp.]